MPIIPYDDDDDEDEDDDGDVDDGDPLPLLGSTLAKGEEAVPGSQCRL